MRTLGLAPSRLFTARRVGGLLAALVAIAVVAPASPASAAVIIDINQLALAMQGGGTVTLDSDINEPGTQLYVRNNVTIDFNGFNLNTNATFIDPGYTLTVIGSGTWNSIAGNYEAGIRTRGATLIVDGPTINAVGTRWNAGIGGYYDGGTFILNSGNVTATGGNMGAGVGGGFNYGHGGTVIVNGGTLTANGGDYAAGIGSGLSNGNGAIVTINGGTVFANGGYAGNGIGGGQSPGADGSLSIAQGATVTVTSGASAWALDGPVTVAGTLVIPTGYRNSILVAPTTVTSTGKITGGGTIEGNPYVGGGVLVNHGIVTNASVENIADGFGNLTVTDHAYKVSFDANYPAADPVSPVRVYATTFADGVRTLPTPTRTGYYGLGWNTAADGSGTTVTPTTTLTADTQLYAQWSGGGYVLSPASGSVVAAGNTQFTVGEIADWTTNDVTSAFTFDTSNASDTTSATAGLVGMTSTGDRTVTATLIADGGVTVSSLITVIGDAAHPTDLELTASDLTVDQGDTITLTVELFDPYGNPIPTDDVVITSNQPTDQIVGDTVTFPHASPHVLTATLGALSDSVLVEVSPAQLAATGSEPLVPLSVAGLLLLLGVAAIYRRRHAH